MNPVILACSTLSDYVDAAQQTCQTDYPVILLDRKYHVEPKDMRKHILSNLEALPEEADTVLVAMGFCGGSWQDVVCSKKLVIPRVDDCVTLVMTTSDKLNTCTKEPGHMYMFGDGESGFSINGIYEKLLNDYDEEMAQIVFDMYFEHYYHLDIIDTGLYDCYDLDFVTRAQEDADRIKASIDYVPGSNHLLEKLVSGKWDEQFVVVEPGTNITQGTFF